MCYTVDPKLSVSSFVTQGLPLPVSLPYGNRLSLSRGFLSIHHLRTLFVLFCFLLEEFSELSIRNSALDPWPECCSLCLVKVASCSSTSKRSLREAEGGPVLPSHHSSVFFSEMLSPPGIGVSPTLGRLAALAPCALTHTPVQESVPLMPHRYSRAFTKSLPGRGTEVICTS